MEGWAILFMWRKDSVLPVCQLVKIPIFYLNTSLSDAMLIFQCLFGMLLCLFKKTKRYT